MPNGGETCGGAGFLTTNDMEYSVAATVSWSIRITRWWFYFALSTCHIAVLANWEAEDATTEKLPGAWIAFFRF